LILKGVFLGLGSNIGNREEYLKKGVAAIGKMRESRIFRLSSIYETEPWGRKNQEPFLNQVVEIETQLDPKELLDVCQNIEKRLGRQKRDRWGPRAMDIDLLLFGEMIVEEKSVCVPHPLLPERLFVLIPLAEIDPTVVIPGLKKTVKEAIETCLDESHVGLYESGR
jgi:2-amino-4-hydroxy-6-hydroxymethyldihydropteridine diphosphokinase